MSRIWVCAKGSLHICATGHHTGHNTTLDEQGLVKHSFSQVPSVLSHQFKRLLMVVPMQ